MQSRVSPGNRTISRALILAAALLTIAALYLGRTVLIPFTLAILVSFLLSPLVARLKRWGLRHLTAVCLVGGFTLVAVMVMAVLFTIQMKDLVDHLPGYVNEARDKVRVVTDPLSGMVGRASRSVKDIAAANGPSDSRPAAATVPVEVVDSSKEMAVFGGILARLGEALAMLGIVAVLAGAILIQGNDLRDRLVRLIGDNRVSVTTSALDDAAERVGRYLLKQTMLNGAQGVVVAVGLTLLGLPGAIMWGFMWAVLRFLPYIGPWLGAAMPIITAMGHFDGWSQPLIVILMFILIEVACNVIFEPWLYGTGTGISPLAVLLAALFWASLWGWVGLLLATPLTVCLTVLGQYVPQLEFLQILLGDKPVLKPRVRLYQRLLAGSIDDAREILRVEIKQRGPSEAMQSALLQALALAERDAKGGRIDQEKLAAVEAGADDLTRELSEIESAAAPTPPIGRGLCIPVRDEADAIAARMLGGIGRRGGVEVETIGVGHLASELVERIESDDADAVLLSALSDTRAPHVRNILRRLAGGGRQRPILLAVWAGDRASTEFAERIAEEFEVEVVTTLDEAATALRYACMQGRALRRRGEPGAHASPGAPVVAAVSR